MRANDGKVCCGFEEKVETICSASKIEFLHEKGDGLGDSAIRRWNWRLRGEEKENFPGRPIQYGVLQNLESSLARSSRGNFTVPQRQIESNP